MRASTRVLLLVALERLPENCRYHGSEIEEQNPNRRQWYSGACCATGEPSLIRRRATEALAAEPDDNLSSATGAFTVGSGAKAGSVTISYAGPNIQGPVVHLDREEARQLAIALIDQVKETPEEQAIRHQRLAQRFGSRPDDGR